MADPQQPAPTKEGIEASIRDSMSSALQGIAREMAATNQRAQEMASSGSGFGSVDKLLTAMTDKLISPVGLIGAFAATSKALDNFAVGQLQLQNFARDTGMAVKEVQNYRQQLGLLGVPADQANAAIGRLGANMQAAAATPWASSFIKQIMQTNPALAVRLQKYADLGQTGKATADIYNEYIKSNRAGRAALAQAAQMSHTEILALGQDTTGLIKAWDELPGAELEYHKNILNITQTQENIWKGIASNAVDGIAKIAGGWEGMDAAAHKVTEFINVEVKKAFVDFTAILKDVRSFVEWLETRAPTLEVPKENIPKIEWDEWWRLKKKEFGLGGKSDELPAHPIDLFEDGKYQLQGEGGNANELVETGKQSNRILTDIHDVLKKMWDKGQALPQRRQEGGAVLEGQPYEVGEAEPEVFAAGGGYRMVGEGGPEIIRPQKTGRIVSEIEAAAREYQPPSPTSQMLGTAMGLGGLTYGAAKFLKGHAGGGDELKSRARKLFGIEDPGEPAPWASGGEWGRGLSSSSFGSREEGTPPWMASEPMGSLQSREEGAPAWGGASGNLPAEILSEARNAALAGGPRAVQEYIRSRGYEVHAAWCGDFAKTVVSSAGGTPPDNAEVASNWRNFGKQVVAPEEGDIAVQRMNRSGGGYVRTGKPGSHVTIVDAIDPRTGTFTGLGGNQSKGMRSNFRTGGYEFFRQSERLNDSLMGENGSRPSLNANIRFKNVPLGVETSVRGEGIDTLKSTNEKQLMRYAPAESGMDNGY